MGGVPTKPLDKAISDKIDPHDLEGFKCTPPNSLCAWGCIASPCLYAGTNRQIMLMNQFLTDNPNPLDWDDETVAKWNKIMPQNYCCTGFDTTAVTYGAVRGWANDQSDAAGALVGCLAAINQYENLSGVPPEEQGKFNCQLWTRACFCSPCVLCTNAYALRQAHAKIRLAESTASTVVYKEPTAVASRVQALEMLLPLRM
tara:strand:- start:1119 stop:1721 length:603 start_codon:yes stop_codon:yes gene_type:complete